MTSFLNSPAATRWTAAICGVVLVAVLLTAYWPATKPQARALPKDNWKERWPSLMADATSGERPILKIRHLEPGDLSSLPIPTKPFGLDFGGQMYSENNQGHDAYMCPMTDEGLVELSRFSTLEWLDLHLSTRLSATGLRELQKLKRLKSLRVSWIPIDDAGFKEICACTELEELDLTNTKITDVGMADISALVNLRKLTLDRTTISAAGLKHVASLSQLQELSLVQVPIGGSELKSLTSLSKLEVLHIDHLGDGETVYLAQLPRLRRLSCGSTDITPEGALVLRAAKHLRSLWLGHNRFNTEEIRAIQTALPECEVDAFDGY